MTIVLSEKAPITSKFSHYISINVLEISTVHLPLKEEIMIFDIDGTLYSDKKHLVDMVENASLLFSEYLKVSIEEAREIHLKKHLETQCGIKSCIREYKLPFKLILELHLNLFKEDNFQNDLVLKQLLLELGKTKTLICFTNGSEINARYIIEKLGIKECFDLIITNDYEAFSACKPQFKAFEAVNRALNLNDKKVLFFDDEIKNCLVAKSAGWESYHITTEKTLISYLLEIDSEKENFNKTF